MSCSSLARESILIVSPHTGIQSQSGGELEVESPDAVLIYAAGAAGWVADCLAAARRPQVAADLAELCGIDWDRFAAVFTPALDAGVLFDVSSFITAHTSAGQLDAYYDVCDAWARDIFVRDFWNTVLSGRASTRLMLGWCEQFYQRTVGADEHNDVAVINCTLAEVAEALRDHFREEVGHGEIFLQGLEAAGVRREAVVVRPPLPSTRALIDYFSYLGRTDTLAYLACYGILHSPRDGQTLEAVRAQFEGLVAAYPEAAPAIHRIGQHAEIDVSAGHDQIVLEPYLLARAPLSPDEARRVLQSISGTVKVFNQFFDGIMAAYGETGPRPLA